MLDLARKLFDGIPECKLPAKQDTFQKYRTEFNQDVFVNECTFMKNVLDESKIPLVLAHSDIHPANLIINDDDTGVTLLDFEFMAVNYEFCYMGFMFVSWETGWCDPNPPKLKDDLRDTYVRAYLRAQYESRDKNPDVIPEEEVEMSLIALKIVETAIYLRFIVRSMYLVNPGRFDRFQVYPVAKKLYYENKPQMRTLLDKYSELKTVLGKWCATWSNWWINARLPCWCYDVETLSELMAPWGGFFGQLWFPAIKGQPEMRRYNILCRSSNLLNKWDVGVIAMSPLLNHHLKK